MNHPNRSETNRNRDANPTVAQIRAARERAGLTQTEAARRVYAPLRAWQCWESEGGENRPMHPALFELFLIKTGKTSGPGNDGDSFDESVRFDECVARVVETATRNAREVGVVEDFVRPTAAQAGEAVEQYVTRYGLRRIASRQVEPIAVSGPRSLSVVKSIAAR